MCPYMAVPLIHPTGGGRGRVDDCGMAQERPLGGQGHPKTTRAQPDHGPQAGT